MGLVVPPVEQDISIHQGATWVENFQWMYGADEESQVSVDLTGADAFATLRESFDALEPLAVASVTAGTITLAADGNIEIRFPRVLENLDVRDKQKIYRQLEIHWPDGDVCRLVMGKATVTLETTHLEDEA